jgi:nucleoside-diphosphate-sugar epimerase
VAGRHFDAVLEVSWQPDFVRAAVAARAGSADHWVYVSSGSVYADDATPGMDESAATHAPRSGSGPAGMHEYAAAKVACEDAVVTGVGGSAATIARAGLIGGYGDRSDRLGYWPARLARVRRARERVLVPPLDMPVQVIDVADLARWLVDCADRRIAGTFNAVGEQHRFGDLLEACGRATGTSITPVQADDDWLLGQGVEPYMGPESLPLWLPAAGFAGHATRSGAAARGTGLRSRPLDATVRAALDWERRLGLHRPRKAGLSAAREAELLAALPH